MFEGYWESMVSLVVTATNKFKGVIKNEEENDMVYSCECRRPTNPLIIEKDPFHFKIMGLALC